MDRKALKRHALHADKYKDSTMDKSSSGEFKIQVRTRISINIQLFLVSHFARFWLKTDLTWRAEWIKMEFSKVSDTLYLHF